MAAFPAMAQEPEQIFLNHKKPLVLPDVRFEGAGGESIALADFKGKLVLLNVWATWCAPCRQELPTLDRLQAQLGGPDFEVVALSVDQASVDSLRRFYEQVGVSRLAVYVDTSGKAAHELNVRGLPTTLLIDRSGRELAWVLVPAAWDSPAMIAFLKTYIGAKSGGIPAHPTLAAPAVPSNPFPAETRAQIRDASATTH